MVISRTPFRISFFGGGSDFPDYYSKHGGAVLSTTIDKYCYISTRLLPPFFDHKYRIVYSNREEVSRILDIKHPSVRETLKFLCFKQGLSIHHDSDLPARTGLGSSSSFTVGLLNTLYALEGKMVSKKQLAMEAIHIEQNLIKEHVGSQDQTIVAFGGFNKIEFKPDLSIEVNPIIFHGEKKDFFHRHIQMYFTGFSRFSSDIAKHHVEAISKKKNELKAIREMVEEAISILGNSHNAYDDFGKLLHESWKLKRSLTDKITTSYIDDIYSAARSVGALGGKILGAGGGGFIIFFVKPEDRSRVRRKLNKLLYVPFKFESLGSQIIYYRTDYNMNFTRR